MPHSPGRIGPNAIIRLIEAAAESLGPAEPNHLLRDAHLAKYCEAEPASMVDESEVVALYAALAARAPYAAERIAADAGRRTARYLLANRIPRAVQALLRVAPPRLAARFLLKAIGGHAWTFAGSGRFSATVARGADVRVEGGPFTAPGAAGPPLRAFYAAVFGALFKELVSGRARSEAHLTEAGCAISIIWARAAGAKTQKTLAMR